MIPNITGVRNGYIVDCTSTDDLVSALQGSTNNNPIIVRVLNDVNLEGLNAPFKLKTHTANITMVGIYMADVERFPVLIGRSHTIEIESGAINIIIRNLRFNQKNPNHPSKGADCITLGKLGRTTITVDGEEFVTDNCNHIWIDHCSFETYSEGGDASDRKNVTHQLAPDLTIKTEVSVTTAWKIMNV